MASPLEPKPGFDWTKIRWTGPLAPVDETCSYCGAAIPEESVPLRLWNAESWAAVFCEGCMQTWWGFQITLREDRRRAMTDDYRAHLRRRLVDTGVPTPLHEGLTEYFAARRPTGSFLKACLANDFTQACLRADEENWFSLREIARFLVWYVPSTAWGSTEAVEAWLADPAPVPEPFE